MIPLNTYTTSLPYNGITLKSSADYFEWIRSVTRHLKATRSYHGFVTPPQEGWEKDPHMIRDQEAAIAFLSCFVSDHVYDRCLANCATAFEAWNSIQKEYGTCSPAEGLRLKVSLSQLKYTVGCEGEAHVERFESLIGRIALAEGTEMPITSLTGYFLGTLPDTDFWLTWQSSHDDCGKSWPELREKFLRDSKRNHNRASVALPERTEHGRGEVSAVANSRPWLLPKYVKGESLRTIGEILIEFGYPYCHHHKTMTHADGTCYERGSKQQNQQHQRKPAQNPPNDKGLGAKTATTEPVDALVEELFGFTA
jgi:hypothetical protein